MGSQTRSSKRASKLAPRELQKWRVQGNPSPTLRQPFADPSPTLRRPFANPSPTFRQPFANLFCQPLSKPLFPWTPGAGLETRVNQGRKRNPNTNFLVRILSGGVGVFHVKGWGPKSSGCPSKPREIKLFGGIFRDFAGTSRACSKSLRKKVCVHFSFPTLRLSSDLINMIGS